MRQTKKVKFARLAQGIGNIRKGKRPMPKIHTDGSVTTRPCVPCPDVPEADVMRVTEEWIVRHGCTIDRLNNGAGHLDGSPNYGMYGIKGGGDWLGMLPNGRHLEIECKKGKGGRQSKHQFKRMMRVRRGGGVYVLIHGLPELEVKLLPLLKNINLVVDIQPAPW